MAGAPPPRPRTRPGPAALALAAALATSGCNQGAQGTPDTTTTTRARAATTTAYTGPATTAPPPPLALGAELRTAEGNAVKVTAWVRPVRQDLVAPQPGSEFGAADAEVCAGRRGARRVTPESFVVLLADGTRVRRTFFGPQEPLLADARLAAGECVRGWVNFEVPAGAAVAFVAFEGSTAGRWRVATGRTR